MADKMTCEICGEHHLVKCYGGFMCENCGTKYSKEDAKSLWRRCNGSDDKDDGEIALGLLDRFAQRKHELRMEKIKLKNKEREAKLLKEKQEAEERAREAENEHPIVEIVEIVFGTIVVIALLIFMAFYKQY